MVAVLAGGLVLGAGVTVWLLRTRASASAAIEASGTVEATDAVLGFAASGRISAIHLDEGDVARAGAPIAELDTGAMMAKLRQSREQVRMAAAQLADLERGARPQELEDRRQLVAAARRELDDAELDLSRTRELAAKSIVSRQALDKAQVARDVAESRYTQARAALSLMEAGARRDQIAAARAALAAARAQVTTLEATLPDYVIRAPWSGVVTARARQPGEAVSPGMPVLTVMNTNDRWVRIYIPEGRLGAVALGQRATITTDAFPHHPFVGQVSWISSEAEFTPRNVQTKDERVRLVYAAKVRILDDTALVLKPGTPADVSLAPRSP